MILALSMADGDNFLPDRDFYDPLRKFAAVFAVTF